MKINQLAILIFVFILAAVLRFYKLDINPPGLYWDEAAFGYDAYSILKTAKDHHGHFLPLLLESFGDWKLPGYHYLLVPSIAIFGLNEFAVRFPSAALGSLSVVIFFFLVKKIFNNYNVALLASLFLAISPWHIQFSRGGFESTAGLFFVLSGVYLFILAKERKRTLIFTFAFLLLILSMYTYHAYRIFTPLLIVSLLVIFRRQLNPKKLIIPSLIAILLLIPLISITTREEGRARATSQSAFRKEEAESTRIDYDQKSKKPLRFLSKYLNQPVYFSYLAFNGYLSHFSPTFLFFKGDQTGRHSQVDMGQIYAFEAILILVAIFSVKNLNPKLLKLMVAWFIISPIPAMIVTPTPHAYRTLQMAPALAFFSGIGAYYLFFQKRFLLLKLLFLAIILYSFITYLHLLFVHYPKKFAADWQDGYREMVYQIRKYQNQFDLVYVTNINQVPYIYLLFYQKYDPQKFIDLRGTRDSFDKYHFIDDEVDVYNKGRILYVAPSWKKVDGKWLSAVNDSAGRHIYSLWEINGQK